MIHKIAFIGTGVMGAPMVKNLSKNYYLNVYNRTASKAFALENDKIKAFNTIKECIDGADIICTMVGFPSDVENVYQQIFATNTTATIAIDFTTSSPTLAKSLYQQGKQHHLSIIDCPVSGGDSGAINATLSCMVGGDEDTYQAILPLLQCVGKIITYCGQAGNGQHIKAVNQIVIAGTIGGVCEAIAYAKANNLHKDTVFSCIENGAAGSWQLSNNGKKAFDGDYNPGFYIKHFIKDMNIALDNMEQLNQQLPVLKLVCEQYKQLLDNGDGNLGTQALLKYYIDK